MITLLNFTKEILRDPLILSRISLKQEYYYSQHLLRQRLCHGGQRTTACTVMRRFLESCNTMNKGIFF